MKKLRAIDRPKSPESAPNGRPHALSIRHGGTSALRRARLDKRTAEARYEVQVIAALTHHLGGAARITTPQSILIEHTARLRLLAELAMSEVRRSGVTGKAGLSGALAAYLATTREMRHCLETIGLARVELPAPSASELLAGTNMPEAVDA